jgi:hypothetical protein
VGELVLGAVDQLRDGVEAALADVLDDLGGPEAAAVRLPVEIRHEEDGVPGGGFGGHRVDGNPGAKGPHVPGVDFGVDVEVLLPLPVPRLEHHLGLGLGPS